MDHDRLVNGLIEHEQLMARLYREMAIRVPAKRELLEGLSREEEAHAGMFLTVKNVLLPSGILSENDITVTVRQLEAQRDAVQKIIASLENRSFREQEIVNMLLDLELSSVELQINRVIVEHRDEPGLRIFVEILDSEQAHNQVLEEWRSGMT